VTTARIAGRTLAAGGGGFMRLLPYGFTRWAIARMNAEGHPAILYFHPWEIDPGQPRVADAPIKSKIRHYNGLSAMAGKLKKLLTDFEWTRADALLPAQQDRAQPWRAAA
jgi:hypothetical protein